MRVDLEQKTEAWYVWRRDKITASEMSSVMNVNPWRSRNKLWKQKLGIIPDTVSNYHMERGNVLEPIARKLVEERLSRAFNPTCYISDALSWAAASLDGIDDSGETIIEIKCPSNPDTCIPENYLPQIHWQLLCSGAKQCYYCSFCGGELTIFLVGRDEDYIKEMIAEAQSFRLQLKNLEEPEVDIRECREVSDLEICSLIPSYEHADSQEKYFKQLKEDIRLKWIGAAHGENARIGSYIVSKTNKKGLVQYHKIPELQHIDLDFYRENPKEVWSIKKGRR